MTVHNRVTKSVSKKGKQYYMSRCRTCIDESETILLRLKKKTLNRLLAHHVNAVEESTNFFMIMITALNK